MPTYDTPRPIDVSVELQVGTLHIVASDRADTVVTVSPTNPAKALDRRGADETRVEFADDRLTVVGPRPRFSLVGPTESVDLRIEVPTASRLTAKVAVGAVSTVGTLGATRIKASMGGVDVESAGDLWVRAGHGGVTVGRATGSAEITLDHGGLRAGRLGAGAVLKASHGGIRVDEVDGEVEAKLSYGELSIGRARDSVTARVAYGAVQLDEVSAGSLDLESGFGQVSVGVRPGVAAWLDLSSRDGRVRSELDGDRAPEPGEPTVAVRARTRFGDIRVHRAG